jgi:hypothetical protein
MKNSTNGNAASAVEITSPDECDAQVLHLRLAGVSVRRIGRRYGLTDKQVLAALDRTLPTLDAEAPARYLRESLGQLDELSSWWYGQAKTSAPAAMLCLRINERKAALLGLDAPQHVRMDPIQIIANAGPQQGSTAALIAELDRIAEERQRSVPGLLVEGDPSDPSVA